MSYRCDGNFLPQQKQNEIGAPKCYSLKKVDKILIKCLIPFTLRWHRKITNQFYTEAAIWIMAPKNCYRYAHHFDT